jgi:hypothetical protein
MLLNQKTNIHVNSHFHSSDYPALKLGLAVIDERLANLPIIHKADMLIAFLKGQSVPDLWKAKNPAVAALLLTYTLPMRQLEDLFSQSRSAKFFTAELETYVRNWFKVTTSTY